MVACLFLLVDDKVIQNVLSLDLSPMFDEAAFERKILPPNLRGHSTWFWELMSTFWKMSLCWQLLQ